MSTRYGSEISILQEYNNDETGYWKIQEQVDEREKQERERERKNMEINRRNNEFIALYDNNIDTICDMIKTLKANIKSKQEAHDYNGLTRNSDIYWLQRERNEYIRDYYWRWIDELEQYHEIKSYPEEFIGAMNSYLNNTY